MRITPLADRILVKRVEPEETSRGGMVIPDTAKEIQQEAEAVAVRPGCLNDSGKRVPVDVKKSSRELIGKYSGTEMKLKGEDHLIVREEDVLAVIER
jgi:chaperonin GroES